jgi:hypothetical protein
VFWGSRPAATQTEGQVAIRQNALNVEDSDIPLPHMQRIADREKLLLPVELQLVQGFPPRFPAKAIELLTVDTNDVTEIILPAKNKPDHSVEF